MFPHRRRRNRCRRRCGHRCRRGCRCKDMCTYGSTCALGIPRYGIAYCFTWLFVMLYLSTYASQVAFFML